MTNDCRILIASRKSGIAWRSHLQFARAAHWRVVGIVDPRAKAAFENGYAAADIVLIEAEDLIWLLEHRPGQARTAFERAPPMILLEERDMLDIVARAPPSWGLLMQQCLANVSVDRLALACDGYIVMTATLVELLRRDGLRLEIVETLSRDELCVLAYLGAAMSNRCIAEKSGMLEDRVKAMTRSLTQAAPEEQDHLGGLCCRKRGPAISCGGEAPKFARSSSTHSVQLGCKRLSGSISLLCRRAHR
jgi:hypothetical protein